uniref:PPM-type phosphatase domain-containing protein n=1 Tax=Globisporangium ultimum (strain ATCC 200006 / CBS 805.95 / DAOM BR144) TaxID=431595 RepID=K3WGS4_GLOUD
MSGGGSDVARITPAQCNAQHAPTVSGGGAEFVKGSSSPILQLESEHFAKLEHPLAKRFSCATYKSNAPSEDRFNIQSTANGDVCAAIFDGHGGWQVAEFVRKTLIGNIEKELRPTEQQHASPSEVTLAIQRAFGRTDREFMVQIAPAFHAGFGTVARCGSCALVALVREGTLHVANAGDSRAVLGRTDPSDDEKLLAVPLSKDQNAMAAFEQAKLKLEHPSEPEPFVCRTPNSCYVKNALQPTRAFGDFPLKYAEFNGPAYVDGDRSAGHHFPEPFSPPYITVVPEITSIPIKSDDKFVILGSDGLWDFVSNGEAVDVVRAQVARGEYDSAARALVDRTLQNAAAKANLTYEELLKLPPGNDRRPLHDDTTVIVLFF